MLKFERRMAEQEDASFPWSWKNLRGQGPAHRSPMTLLLFTIAGFEPLTNPSRKSLCDEVTPIPKALFVTNLK